MAGNLSKSLIDKLTEFFCHEIQSGVLDGRTYMMTLRNGTTDSNLTNKYLDIRVEASKCGYSENEAFRVFELNNGFIFDMDLIIAKMIARMIVKKALKDEKEIKKQLDMLETGPNERRNDDMKALAKKCLKEFKSGKTYTEVALFSRNSTNKIIITGNGEHGEKVVVQYNAYAVRHWDIETINEKYLIPRGMKIRVAEACGVLSSKSGVRYILHFESVGRR